MNIIINYYEAFLLTLICGGGIVFIGWMNGWFDRFLRKSAPGTDATAQSNPDDNINSSQESDIR